MSMKTNVAVCPRVPYGHHFTKCSWRSSCTTSENWLCSYSIYHSKPCSYAALRQAKTTACQENRPLCHQQKNLRNIPADTTRMDCCYGLIQNESRESIE